VQLLVGCHVVDCKSPSGVSELVIPCTTICDLQGVYQIEDDTILLSLKY